MRGDSVAFPPGGCAYLHTHQGPGIRCLIEGGIRIDTHGRSTSYGPGAAWYESGPEPVFAQAAPDRPSRFVRVMILPRALIGKSSLQLTNEADKSKPRAQQYKIFVDAPIAFAEKRIASSANHVAVLGRASLLAASPSHIGLKARSSSTSISIGLLPLRPSASRSVVSASVLARSAGTPSERESATKSIGGSRSSMPT